MNLNLLEDDLENNYLINLSQRLLSSYTKTWPIVRWLTIQRLDDGKIHFNFPCKKHKGLYSNRKIKEGRKETTNLVQENVLKNFILWKIQVKYIGYEYIIYLFTSILIN